MITLSPETVLHYAMNPVTPVTSILYPAAAEQYFLAAGDAANVALSRRLLVENRLTIAFNVLFDRTLFDFMDDLHTAWLDRGRGSALRFSHQAEDYDSAVNAFRLAAKDAETMEDAGPRLQTLAGLARCFPDAVSSLASLRDWTARAQDVLRPQWEAVLVLLGARILWQMGILHGSFLELREAASLLRTSDPASGREEGFVRYAAALAVLLNGDAGVSDLSDAVDELKEAISCFRRADGPFPRILLKRLSESHEALGRAYFAQNDMPSASRHFQESANLEEHAAGHRIPVARVLTKRATKSRWLSALQSLIGG